MQISCLPRIEALPITKRVELISKKKFAKVVLNTESETFVVHVLALDARLAGILIHLVRETQIAFLFIKKITITNKYSDFADVFSEEKAFVLPE